MEDYLFISYLNISKIFYNYLYVGIAIILLQPCYVLWNLVAIINSSLI